MKSDHTPRTPLWRRMAVLIAMTATLVAAFAASEYAGKAEDRLHASSRQNQLNAEQSACQQEVLVTVLQALQARSSFAETTAEIEVLKDKAVLAFDEAQKTFLLSRLQKPGIDGDKAFQVYLAAIVAHEKALRATITSIRDQLRVRANNPYPTLARLRDCSQDKLAQEAGQ